MTDLYNKATSASRRTIVRFPDGMHNDSWMKNGYIESIITFLHHVFPEQYDLPTETDSISTPMNDAPELTFRGNEEKEL